MAGMKNVSLAVGQVVVVRKGKFAGDRFVVVGLSSKESRVFIADGDKISVKAPKRKNPLHLQGTRLVLTDVINRVSSEKPLDNGWLRSQIATVQDRRVQLGSKEVEATA